MLASLISFEYLSLSALMNFVNCSGGLLTATTPRSANFFFTSGSASAFTVSAFSLATNCFGVFAGNSTPHQLRATRPGASSWHIGRDGISSNFSPPVRHSAGSLPAPPRAHAARIVLAHRQVRDQLELLPAGEAQRAQLAGAHVRHRRQRVGEDEVDLP